MSIDAKQDGSGPVRRCLDIEAALRWAYRDELPKLTPVSTRDMALRQGPATAGSGWDAIDTFAQLLACIDDNRYGVVPDLTAMDDPHPDAILIGDAVRALDDLDLSIPDDWNPIADLGDLGEIARAAVRTAVAAETVMTDRGTRRLKMRPSSLLRKYALLGGVPEWEADVPEVKFVANNNGSPRWFVKRFLWQTTADNRQVHVEVEQDGYNHRAKRPYGDAYNKQYLDPNPHLAIVSRAEYEVWHAALQFLTDELGPTLQSIRLSAFVQPSRPWETGRPHAGVVRRDLTERRATPPARKPARKSRAKALDMRPGLGVA